MLENVYIEKLQVNDEDTLLVHFNTDYLGPEQVGEMLVELQKKFPKNTIIPILPKYGIEKVEKGTGMPYIIEPSSYCYHE